jgi:hypothetical protein
MPGPLSAWLRAGLACAALVTVLPSRFAGAAPDAEGCAMSYERAQEHRRRGAFVEARARLVSCSNPSCPAFVIKDCQHWLEEIEVALPTVVLAARSGERDLDEVTVLSDGRLLTERLTGRAIALNPGKHALTFSAPGVVPRVLDVVIAEGQKNRLIVAELAALKPAVAAAPAARAESAASLGNVGASAAVAPAHHAQHARDAFWRPATMALLATGAIGVGTFAGFGLSGYRDESHLREQCAPQCVPEAVSDISRKYLIADVGLAVGVVALGLAGYLYAFTPGEAHLTMQVAPGGGSVGVAKVF